MGSLQIACHLTVGLAVVYEYEYSVISAIDCVVFILHTVQSRCVIIIVLLKIFYLICTALGLLSRDVCLSCMFSVLFLRLQLKELNHDNIKPFIGACVEPGHICYLMQACSRGSLQVSDVTVKARRERC